MELKQLITRGLVHRGVQHSCVDTATDVSSTERMRSNRTHGHIIHQCARARARVCVCVCERERGGGQEGGGGASARGREGVRCVRACVRAPYPVCRR